MHHCTIVDLPVQFQNSVILCLTAQSLICLDIFKIA